MSKPSSHPYAELQSISNFSFLEGGSHPEELVATAHELGLHSITIADRNTLAGVVRGHAEAKKRGMKFIPAARLDVTEGISFLSLPKDRAAYGRLSQLLTLGKRRAEKGECHISLKDLTAYIEGQILIIIPSLNGDPEGLISEVKRCKTALGPNLYLAAHRSYTGDQRSNLAVIDHVCHLTGVKMVATGDVIYHAPYRRPLQDVLTCIKNHTTIQKAGFLLQANAERHLKPPEDIYTLFKGYEAAVARTVEIADQCQFSMDELGYHYPSEPVPQGKTPQQHLADLTLQGAHIRYPQGIPEKISKNLQKELALIDKLDYAHYFLTVHDIVHWARSQEILCQGRGSAANSSVCYCLHITSVDPDEIDLLFERFISEERKEPPDIDVDFEHERREEVMQYIYARYGRERAGITATVVSYRARSAVREVGKALGLSEDVTAALAGTVWGWSSDGLAEKHVRDAGLNPDDLLLHKTLDIAHQLIGFPRHLSQHVGGYVLTEDPLSRIVPIGNAAMENRTFIEWDKDDIDTLKILKVDVLALGMLTCIRKCLNLLRKHYAIDMDLADFFPANDEATYDMLCKGDSVGVFQVESRAQMNMLPRLKPRKFYDLVIEVAIVRPGPIQGDMVHPYLRRRDGIEKVHYPSPHPDHGDKDELRRVLEKTLGVPIFQEQAMRIAIEAAKFSPDEANLLRKAMATFRRRGKIEELEKKMISRMVARGYEEGFATSCFNQIKGFGEYGFPESHAASFALLVYVSSYLKCHYPEVFACGLLNSQPMGFYAPAQIVRDAKEHGVCVRPVDVNFSQWDNQLETEGTKSKWALRLGFRQVSGFQEEQATLLVKHRDRPYKNMEDLWRRSTLPVSALKKLAAADAMRSMGLDRRQALWEISAIKTTDRLPLFDFNETSQSGPEATINLPETPLCEHVISDYQTLRLSLKAHPMHFLRSNYTQQNIRSTKDIHSLADGTYLKIAGVVLVRQRPGSAKGVMFMTIEDEFGVANIVVWQKIFEKYRQVAMGTRLVCISGKIQRTKDIIHVVANRLEDHTHLLLGLADADDRPHIRQNDQNQRSLARSQHTQPRTHPRDVRIIPRSRDFH